MLSRSGIRLILAQYLQDDLNCPCVGMYYFVVLRLLILVVSFPFLRRIFTQDVR
jgi:hypothetical protein